MNWEQYFPHPKFRTYQKETIQKIINAFESGKRIVLAEMPTGAGKSAVGYTLGCYFKSAFYVTVNKFLQSQLCADFAENGKWVKETPMVELKGRNAYKCNYYERTLDDANFTFTSPEQKDRFIKLNNEYTDCSKGECKRKGKSKLKYCDGHCIYFNQFNKAINSSFTLMNFYSFIFQTEFVPTWGKRDILIIDECHASEQVLMDYVSISLNEKNIKMSIPKLETSEEYLVYFEDNNLTGIIEQNILDAHTKGDQEQEELWEKQALKYIIFKSSITSDTSKWISKYDIIDIGGEKIGKIEIKPLFIDKFAYPLLFSKADKILMMSATILDADIMCESLGLDKSEVESIRIHSTFPVKNRPIFYRPSGSMSYANKSTTLPKMMKDIEIISKENEKYRGLFHTHTFEISKYVMDNASKNLKSRLFYQVDYQTKEEMVEKFLKSDNGIIVAPAFHEGVSFEGDMARWQLVLKVPFPGIGDNPQLKMRMELSSTYYSFLAALKLVQSSGRIVRSETDWGYTYILDENFKQFFHRTSYMLPKWFKEAIIWH